MKVFQHTDMELFDMFNVEITPDVPHSRGDRRATIDEPYCFNDIKTCLWSKTKRPLTRGFKKALQSADNIVDGVTDQPPGSGRVADLADFYEKAMLFDEPPSPFDIDDE